MATLVTDNFARTSATSPGIAQTGQSWRAELGTWGTDGSSIYSVSNADNDQVTIECGTENQDATVTFKQGAAEDGLSPELLLRWSDTYDAYWLEVRPDGSMNMRHWASFNEFGTEQPPGTAKNGDVIRFSAFTNAQGGCDLKAYVNGTLLMTGTDTDTSRRGSRMGFRIGAIGGADLTKWSNLTVVDQNGATTNPEGGGTTTPGVATRKDSTMRVGNAWVDVVSRQRINNFWVPSVDGSTNTTPGSGTGGSGGGTAFPNA